MTGTGFEPVNARVKGVCVNRFTNPPGKAELNLPFSLDASVEIGKIRRLLTAILKLIYKMERVMGAEPTYSAWKADVLPLNYTRIWWRMWDLNPRPSACKADVLAN